MLQPAAREHFNRLYSLSLLHKFQMMYHSTSDQIRRLSPFYRTDYLSVAVLKSVCRRCGSFTHSICLWGVAEQSFQLTMNRLSFSSWRVNFRETFSAPNWAQLICLWFPSTCYVFNKVREKGSFIELIILPSRYSSSKCLSPLTDPTFHAHLANRRSSSFLCSCKAKQASLGDLGTTTRKMEN